MQRCAKSAARCSRPTCRSKWCAAFVEQVRERAVGAEVTRSVTPGQQVVKIVHDELVKVLGETQVPIDFNATAAGDHPDGRPAGLGQDHHHRQDRQAPEGAAGQEGPARLARHRRPAAKEQLRVLGEQIGVDTLPIVANENPGRRSPAAPSAKASSAAMTC